MFQNSRHIHFIGIGGSGISAIARWAHQIGKKVTGSDIAKNRNIKSLTAKGIPVTIGHDIGHILASMSMIVYSEAIDKKNNPEYLEAKKKGLKTISYFEALGMISKEKKTIVVAGTHGKTTTTAMLGMALIEAGIDPTVVVGSQVKAFDDSNLHVGNSDWLVVEGCEYRRSFLHLQPFGVILLNCEAEHLDYYKDEADYVSAFEALVQNIPEEGFLVFNQENALCQKIATKASCKTLPVKKYYAKGLHFQLKVIGDFNVLNASHAYLAAKQITTESEKVKKGLESFVGTRRRQEIKGEKNGILVIDDYAHHPTEIKATLGAINQAYADRRILCVFQPHQYSRTHQLMDEFEDAFVDADWVMIPNIYEARDTDEDKAKINASSFAEAVGKQQPNVQHTHDLQTTIQSLQKITHPNDLIITMGAGDVYKIGEGFLE